MPRPKVASREGKEVNSGHDGSRVGAARGRPSHERSRPAAPLPPPPAPEAMDDFFWDADVDHGLLNRRRKNIHTIHGQSTGAGTKLDWLRPYWLGASLFLTLFAFWLLDSLKDPVFASLVDGNLEKHQPPAKVCSVITTLFLVCFLEFLANARQQQEKQQQEQGRNPDMELDAGGGGRWNRMEMMDDPRSAEEVEYEITGYNNISHKKNDHPPGDKVSVDVFAYIGISYCLIFLLMAGLIQQYAYYSASHATKQTKGFDGWYILAYVLYASIESFGSLAVAAFWSFTNSTLSLGDAKRFYGPIVALGQVGAIAGSTLVATNAWSPSTLIIVASLLLVLQILVMRAYDRRFKPTSPLANEDDDDASIRTWIDENITMTKPFWSGVYLILRHNYVILILGVSCLYEISLTCLDYQMKLLGWHRFEETEHVDMSFSQFMGHYGQVVNILSLVLSSMVFPFLIRRFGLRVTLRLFPTLLLVATIVTYGALPGKLAVLFLAMSLLKAMTYSIHDPTKEILYIPTSNGVKLRAKFWIDVVGARISKAIGSGINTYAGSVDRSVRVGTIPSVLTAAALWFMCYLAGIEFDRLLASGEIVGLDEKKELLEGESYMNLPQIDDYDGQIIEFVDDRDSSVADSSLGLDLSKDNLADEDIQQGGAVTRSSTATAGTLEMTSLQPATTNTTVENRR